MGRIRKSSTASFSIRGVGVAMVPAAPMAINCRGRKRISEVKPPALLGDNPKLVVTVDPGSGLLSHPCGRPTSRSRCWSRRSQWQQGSGPQLGRCRLGAKSVSMSGHERVCCHQSLALDLELGGSCIQLVLVEAQHPLPAHSARQAAARTQNGKLVIRPQVLNEDLALWTCHCPLLL